LGKEGYPIGDQQSAPSNWRSLFRFPPSSYAIGKCYREVHQKPCPRAAQLVIVADRGDGESVEFAKR
jgi:hypothetical protein